MRAEEIQSIVIDILVDHGFGVKQEITAASKLGDDLEMDSMDLIEFELVLESKFKVILNITEGTIPSTVEDIVLMIAKTIQ